MTYKEQQKKLELELTRGRTEEEYANVHSMLLYFGVLMAGVVLSFLAALHVGESTDSILAAGAIVIVGIYLSEDLAIVLKEYFYIKFLGDKGVDREDDYFLS
jgi:hypothetical protein